jgi:hypothetical protein
LGKQAGWYTGALMFAIMTAIVVFVAQPWIPLLLAAALAVALMIAGISRGGGYLKRWYHDHNSHAQ